MTYILKKLDILIAGEFGTTPKLESVRVSIHSLQAATKCADAVSSLFHIGLKSKWVGSGCLPFKSWRPVLLPFVVKIKNLTSHEGHISSHCSLPTAHCPLPTSDFWVYISLCVLVEISKRLCCVVQLLQSIINHGQPN